MMRFGKALRILLAAGCVAAIACAAAWLFFSLRPVTAAGDMRRFEVASGDGFREISSALKEEGFIRSKKAFEIYAVLAGTARGLKPGRYNVSPAQSGAEISNILAAGPETETTVTIPEGFTSMDIDWVLSEAGVVKQGEFLKLVLERGLEGRLFPDTYRFYYNSDPEVVLKKFSAEFDRRAAPLLAGDPANIERNLILASILEKEVPDLEDRKIVAGLLIKRVKIGMPLQVDASICYAKELLNPEEPCEPLTKLDKKIASPYNTYLHSGWPPGAITNPGILAIEAALHPKDSPYWYYLSEPKEGKTIFAKSIDEQVMNQLKYLNND
jgi:UPF0755 protein